MDDFTDNDIYIRRLNLGDYNNGFFELLQTLTTSPKPSFDEFRTHFDVLQTNPFQTWVVVNTSSHVVGTARVIMEPKYTHGLSYIAHIEDVVIHPSMRSLGVGKRLVQFLVNRAFQTISLYKVVLNCNETTCCFYESCGFTREGVHMAIRLSSRNI